MLTNFVRAKVSNAFYGDCPWAFSPSPRTTSSPIHRQQIGLGITG